MNVDKISASHVVVRWSGAAFNNEVQTTKGLRWIPRHPETKKGVVNGFGEPKIGTDPEIPE